MKGNAYIIKDAIKTVSKRIALAERRILGGKRIEEETSRITRLKGVIDTMRKTGKLI